jgi:hypothetical protein
MLPRMRETLDEPGANRILGHRHHEGGVCLSLPDGDRPSVNGRYEHIDGEFRQLGGDCEHTIGSALGESVLDIEIAAFDVAALLEPLLECANQGQALLPRPAEDDTDSLDLARRLRLGGERRGEEAASTAHEERSSVHQ